MTNETVIYVACENYIWSYNLSITLYWLFIQWISTKYEQAEGITPLWRSKER